MFFSIRLTALKAPSRLGFSIFHPGFFSLRISGWKMSVSKKRDLMPYSYLGKCLFCRLPPVSRSGVLQRSGSVRRFEFGSWGGGEKMGLKGKPGR